MGDDDIAFVGSEMVVRALKAEGDFASHCRSTYGGDFARKGID